MLFLRKVLEIGVKAFSFTSVRVLTLMTPLAVGSIVIFKHAPSPEVIEVNDPIRQILGETVSNDLRLPPQFASISSTLHNPFVSPVKTTVVPRDAKPQASALTSKELSTSNTTGAPKSVAGGLFQWRNIATEAGSSTTQTNPPTSNSSGSNSGSDSGVAALGSVQQESSSSGTEASTEGDSGDSDGSGSSSSAATTNSAPVLTVPANRIYPLDGSDEPLLQGQAYTLTSNATDPEGDTLTLTCTYESVGLDSNDPNYAATGTACTSLDSLVTSSGVLRKSKATFSSAGVLTWQPTNTQKGTFKFTVVADDSNLTTTKSFYVTVREGYTTSKLLAALDAAYSVEGSELSGTIPAAPRLNGSGTDDFSAWLDLMGSFNATLTGLFGTANPWSGTGETSDPYQLAFSGTADSLSLGNVLSAQTKMMFSAWINPSNATAVDDVILSTGGGTGNGFVLKQAENSAASAKLDLLIGTKTYYDVIMSDKPVRYWRLDEANTATGIVDSTGNSANGTYDAIVTLGQSGALTNDGSTSVSVNRRVNTVNGSTDAQSSSEAWFFMTAWPVATGTIIRSTAGGLTQHNIFVDQNLGLRTTHCTNWVNMYPKASITTNEWHHVVVTYDANTKDLKGYYDGALIFDYGGVPTCGNANVGQFGGSFDGNIDEIAQYDYILSPQQIKNHYEVGKNLRLPDNAILAKGPVGYWRLGESGGTTAFDRSISALNGTYTGTPIYNQDGATSADSDGSVVFNQAARVTGIGDASTFSFIENTGNFSISLWARHTNYTDVSVNQYFLGTTTGATSVDGGIYMRYRGDSQIVQCVLGWEGAGIGVSASLTDNNWHHWTCTGDGSNIRLYKDGIQVDIDAIGGVGTGNSQFGLVLGGHSTANTWAGALDEVAIFNRSLTAAEILELYNTPAKYKCQSVTSLADNTWSFVSGLWDGTTAKLFVNGRQECAVTPGTVFTPSTDLYVGSTSTPNKYWAGAISDLKIYGTSDGSAVGTTTEVKTNFDSSANSYREMPVPEIVTSGLVLSLDAANGDSGITSPANGCSLRTWFDLSSSNHRATLVGFAGCVAGTLGWGGAGSAADPYRLDFNDSATDYVSVGDVSDFSFVQNTGDFTIDAWVRVDDLAESYAAITGSAVGGAEKGFSFYFTNMPGAQRLGFIAVKGGGGDLVYASSADNAINDNNWHHVAVVGNGTSVSFYVDGMQSGATTNFGAPFPTGDSTYPLAIGYDNNATHPFDGAIGQVDIYNNDLTASEIKQNCHALASRYNVTCN